jgi:hypothetical protein
LAAGSLDCRQAKDQGLRRDLKTFAIMGESVPGPRSGTVPRSLSSAEKPEKHAGSKSDRCPKPEETVTALCPEKAPAIALVRPPAALEEALCSTQLLV